MTLIGGQQGWYRSPTMNLVSSIGVPCFGNWRALFVAALLAGGCGDSGGGSETGNTEASTGANTDGTGTTDDATTTTADSSTSDTPTTTGPGAVSYAADIQPIWDARCTLACHEPSGSGFLTTGLDMTAAVSYEQLVDVMSTGVPSMVRIAPGDLAGSYLWHKLKNTQVDAGGGGGQMPAGGLPADQVALIESWIEAGALP